MAVLLALLLSCAALQAAGQAIPYGQPVQTVHYGPYIPVNQTINATNTNRNVASGAAWQRAPTQGNIGWQVPPQEQAQARPVGWQSGVVPPAVPQQAWNGTQGTQVLQGNSAGGRDKAHDLSLGARKMGDELMCDITVAGKESSFWRAARRTVRCPAEGSKQDRMITSVEVKDPRTDGKGSRCKPTSGGVGRAFIELDCKSPGANYPLKPTVIRVFGTPVYQRG